MKLNRVQFNQCGYSINWSVYNNVQYGEHFSLFNETKITRVQDNFKHMWVNFFDIQKAVDNEIR